ncbi:glutaminase liver isoform, mitochondrial-like isoform X2 [Rhodnius prolixus]
MVNKDLILRALKKELNIPDFQLYYKMIETIFDVTQFNYSGEVVLLAPQMMADKEKLWALSLCSSDGQRAEFGQSSVPVVMQAINKIFLYGLALELMGSTLIHSYVGVEYVKTDLHDLYLNREGIPHNAFTYAGTLVICALIISVGMKCMDMSQKFEAYLLYMRNLSFKKKMYFNNTMLLYEKNRSQHMKSIAYFLKAHGCIPNDCNVDSLLDFYYQASAIEVTCEELALMGGTLANNGVNPISGKQIYSKENNRCLLSAMKMYGIYNFSEEFSFNVGLPVKSSITGHILLIIPGIVSFAMYSPLVDEQGISKRGKDFCKALSSENNIHPYDPEQFADLTNFYAKESNELCSIACPLFAAAWKGDLPTLAHLLNSGYQICQKDFSQRTILHVAASIGHLDVVKYLITICPNLIEYKDCMGKTAKDDAVLFCHKAVCHLLDEWGTVKHASEAKESLK